MRIACPSCNAVYQVPDEQLSEGRVVRCVRCATDWLPVVDVPAGGGGEAGPASEPVAEPVAESAAELTTEAAREVQAAEPSPEASARRMALDEDMAGMAVPVAKAAAVPNARRGPWLAIAWVVSVLAVGGAMAALGMRREAVMAAWPPSVRAYAALGLATRP